MQKKPNVPRSLCGRQKLKMFIFLEKYSYRFRIDVLGDFGIKYGLVKL